MPVTPRSVNRELEQHVNNVEYVTAAKTLALDERVVRATANTATDNYSITLPPVAQAAGLFFAVHATIADSKVITLQDQDDSDDWDGDYTLDADNDGILLFSDGIRWWDISNQIA